MPDFPRTPLTCKHSARRPDIEWYCLSVEEPAFAAVVAQTAQAVSGSTGRQPWLLPMSLNLTSIAAEALQDRNSVTRQLRDLVGGRRAK